MERRTKKNVNSFSHNSFQKLFLLSTYLKEEKDQKDWFTGKFEKYILDIKNNVDNMTKEERYDRLSKKLNYNSFSKRKTVFSPEIKKTFRLKTIMKGNKFHLKKYMINKNNNLNNNSEDFANNNSPLSILNLDTKFDFNNKSTKINNDKDKKMFNILNSSIKILGTDNNIECNKKVYKLNFNTLPNLPGVDNKNKYLKKNINNISEKTDLLEKKLIKQERMKYIGFKSKYNKLYNEHKKVQVDIDQYVNPEKDNKYKFNLYESEEEMGNMQRIMKQILNKVKERENNKPSMSEIVNEVQKFKFKEKNLRERIKKSHQRFDYLINDSNIIQKRIDLKCLKNSEMII